MNILVKAGDIVVPDSIDESLLTAAAEQQLAAKILAKKQATKAMLEEGQYAQAMESLANLKEPVDQFFDQVLVNEENDNVRMNRYALLKQLRQLFLQIADISLLQKS